MKATLYLIVDADKNYWVSDKEDSVMVAFNGILPMKLIKITVDCTVPVAQEILVTVSDQGEVVTTLVETKDA